MFGMLFRERDKVKGKDLMHALAILLQHAIESGGEEPISALPLTDSLHLNVRISERNAFLAVTEILNLLTHLSIIKPVEEERHWVFTDVGRLVLRAVAEDVTKFEETGGDPAAEREVLDDLRQPPV